MKRQRTVKTILCTLAVIFIITPHLTGDEYTDTLTNTKEGLSLFKTIASQSKEKMENAAEDIEKVKAFAEKLTDEAKKKKLLDLAEACSKKLTPVVNTLNTFCTQTEHAVNILEAADYIDRLRNLESGDLRGSLSLLASAMSDFGDKIPILGEAIKGYGEITTGMIQAVDNIKKQIDEKDKGVLYSGKMYDKLTEQFKVKYYNYVPQQCTFVFSPDDDIVNGYYIWDEAEEMWYKFGQEINIPEIFQDNLKLGRRLNAPLLKMMGDYYHLISNRKNAGNEIINKILTWKEELLGAGDIFWDLNRRHNSKLFRETMNSEQFVLKYTYDYSFRNWVHRILEEFREEMKKLNPGMKGIKEIDTLDSYHGLKLNRHKLTLLGRDLSPGTHLANDLRDRDKRIATGEPIEDEENQITNFSITASFVDPGTNAAVIEFEATRKHFYDQYTGHDFGHLLWIYRDGWELGRGAPVVEDKIISEKRDGKGNAWWVQHTKYRFTDFIPRGTSYSYLYTVSFNGGSQFGNRMFINKKLDTVISSPGFDFNPATALFSPAGIPPGVPLFSGNVFPIDRLENGAILENQTLRAESEALNPAEKKKARSLELALDLMKSYSTKRVTDLIPGQKAEDEGMNPAEKGALTFRNRLFGEYNDNTRSQNPQSIETLKIAESISYGVEVLSGKKITEQLRFKDSPFIKNVNTQGKAAPGLLQEITESGFPVPSVLNEALSQGLPRLNGEVLDSSTESSMSSGAMEQALKITNTLSRNNRKLIATLQNYGPAAEDVIRQNTGGISLKEVQTAFSADDSAGQGEFIPPGPSGDGLINRVHALYGTGVERLTILYRNEGGQNQLLIPFGYMVRYTESGNPLFVPLDAQGEAMEMVFIMPGRKCLLVNPYSGFTYGVYDL